MFHDAHAILYRAISTRVFNNSFNSDDDDLEIVMNRNLWLKVNLFLGFAVSFLPLYAMLMAVARETFCSYKAPINGPDQQLFKRSMSEFKLIVKREQRQLWFMSLLSALPLAAGAEHGC